MGRRPNKVWIACVECGAKAELGKDEARRAGWVLWLGGSHCRKCARGEESVPAAPAFVDDVVVACSSCGIESISTLERVDGWVPGIHWTKDPEMIQKVIDSRNLREAIDRANAARRGHKHAPPEPKPIQVKLPLCPGWDKPGRVVRVDRRALLPLPPEVTA